MNESGTRRLEVHRFCAPGSIRGLGSREIRKKATMAFLMVAAKPI